MSYELRVSYTFGVAYKLLLVSLIYFSGIYLLVFFNSQELVRVTISYKPVGDS
jgi:hypothetical protein